MPQDSEIAALKAENALLREFFDSWVFLHQVLRETQEVDPRFQKVRREKASQQLTENAHAVSEHIRLNTAAPH